MPERRIKIPYPPGPTGSLTDGWEVAVRESTERWSEVILEDGTLLRIKPAVMGAVRVDNQYDPEGNPVYALKAGHVTVIASSPDHLKKNAQVVKVQ